MSYADELGEMLLSLVDYGEKGRQLALVELAVATAQRAILEVPNGHQSQVLKLVANIRCGRRLAEARIRDQEARAQRLV